MTLTVRLGARSYPIIVERSYAGVPTRLDAMGFMRVGWVVSHASLLARHGRGLLGPLRRAGWQLETIPIPERESSKSLAMAERLIRRLASRPTRGVPVLIAFGGGVIGDLAGFVAAIFRRGIPYLQVPTTLLAQVDSAIGGKVGVDLPQAKNFVGAFYQPRLVWNNVAVLKSLPMRQRRSGVAEIIKYGLIADAALFELLERRLDACLALQPAVISALIERSCAIKARVVSADERETRGIRHQLNFGHTIGHALEAASGYRRWTHGEAIAIGMCAAAALAVELGLCSRAVPERLTRVIERAGLPTRASGVSREAVWGALRYDKKFVRGRPRWVLPRRLGQVIVTEAVPEARVRRVLARYVR